MEQTYLYDDLYSIVCSIDTYCSYVNYFGEVWISSDCHVLSRFKGKPNTM